MKAGRAIERLEAGKADAVGLVREPFVPSAKAAAETLEVLARRGAVATGDADELARLLLALRPAISLVLGWFAVSSPAYRLARAVELLAAERDRLTRDLGISDATVSRAVRELADARARIAELEAEPTGVSVAGLLAVVDRITFDAPDDKPNGPFEQALLDVSGLLRASRWPPVARGLVIEVSAAMAKLCVASADDCRDLRAAADLIRSTLSAPSKEG